MFCFCADAKDASGGQNGEQAFRKPFGNHRKELKFRRIPLEIFSSGTAGALLIQRNAHLAAGQAGAAAPRPLNVLPDKAQKASQSGHLGETAGGCGDLRKDKQRAIDVRDLVKILTLSQIIVFFATILVACFLCDFTNVCYYFS